jgi:hypothetical protein
MFPIRLHRTFVAYYRVYFSIVIAITRHSEGTMLVYGSLEQSPMYVIESDSDVHDYACRDQNKMLWATCLCLPSWEAYSVSSFTMD